jgi:hypothetical protein
LSLKRFAWNLDIYANPDNKFVSKATETSTTLSKDMAAVRQEALAQLDLQDKGHFLQ